MPKIIIDHELCKKDGMCARVCPANIFVQREKLTIPEIIDDSCCISCGHCAAVCPSDAISHSEFPKGAINPIRLEIMPSEDQVIELMKSRRSIRAFRDKPIDRVTIEKIVDGARFAPSGHNSQSTEYVVVQDRAILRKISALVIEYLKFEIKRLSNPFFRTLALLADKELAESGLNEIPGFKRVIRWFEEGADPILFGAPALLVFHARRTDGFADVNAQLALHNASLIAHALGIGHFYTGYVISPSRAPMARTWNRRIPDLIGIPPANKMHGALALGYPVPKFKNWIERKPAQVLWV
jgi:nitroreductase/NAD-dependent dihydropyrimidine dehydrogenase PreA subunit